MKEEYEAVHKAGFILQLDCPDLAVGRHTRFSQKTTAEFVKVVELHVAAINRAVANIPADRIRLHLCWGNYEGPHHHDVALRDIIRPVLAANVGRSRTGSATRVTSTSGQSSRMSNFPQVSSSYLA